MRDRVLAGIIGGGGMAIFIQALIEVLRGG